MGENPANEENAVIKFRTQKLMKAEVFLVDKTEGVGSL